MSVIDPFDLIENIGNDLGVIDPITLSAKTGYGIYKLKTMIAQKLHTQYLPGMQPSTKVNTDATIITSNIHTENDMPQKNRKIDSMTFEYTVRKCGTSSHIILPASMVGKRVRVIVETLD